MPKNLEIKAVYDSPAKAKRISRGLGARYQGTLHQIDTYFKVRSGRLKLREINGKKFELIYYRRPDAHGTRYSDYIIVSLEEPSAAKALFHSLSDVMAVVRKERTLFLYENARIHIDSVKELGSFVEFEVVVNRGKKQARKLMQSLLKIFEIENESLIAGSYSDMILKKK
jgi:adenylate cyclase, class 2